MDSGTQLRRAFVERNAGWAIEAVQLYRFEGITPVPSSTYYAYAWRSGPGDEFTSKEATGLSIVGAIAAVERQVQTT